MLLGYHLSMNKTLISISVSVDVCGEVWFLSPGRGGSRMWIPAHRGGRGEASRGTSQVYGKSRHTGSGEVGGNPVVAHHKCMVSPGTPGR